MKFLLALLLAAGVANAATDTFTRDKTQPCYNYCTAYFTDPGDIAFTYANFVPGSVYAPQPYVLTVQVNGTYYQGRALLDAWYGAGAPLTASDGSQVWVSNLTVTFRTSCTHSGRGQHCTTWRYVDSGTVSTP